MLRFALLLGLLVALGGIAAAAPRGKIVRIERPGSRAGGIQFCEVGRESARCFGPTAPSVGSTISVLDETHVTAELRVLSVSPTDCAWEAKTSVIRGDLKNKSLGAIGGGLTPSARIVHDVPETTLPGAPDEKLAFGLDRDSDPSAIDYLATIYQCDRSMAQSSGANFCINVYVLANKRYTRVVQLNLSSCL